MKLAIVGVGDAGGRIVNRILEFEHNTGRNFSHGNVLVINTDETDYDESEYVPDERHLLIGDTHPNVESRGVDGDLELAVEATRDDLNEIFRAFDPIELSDVDAVLVVAGLAGGTGGGMGAVMIDEFQEMVDKPVYALGVLPSEDEGARPALNAARALQSFVENADNVILFDNDTWQSGEQAEQADDDGYEEANRELAIRIVTALAAGEFEPSTVGENLIDPSDIIRTLDPGGVSSIGYASIEVDTATGGILSWFRKIGFFPWSHNGQDEDDDTTDAAKIKRLVRQAVYSQLTLPCEVSSAERVLIVLSGPPTELSRKGFESSRYWLEQETDTVEVLAGDVPRERSPTLTATVLFSNVTDVSRIDAMQNQAVDDPDILADQAAPSDGDDD